MCVSVQVGPPFTYSDGVQNQQCDHNMICIKLRLVEPVVKGSAEGENKNEKKNDNKDKNKKEDEDKNADKNEDQSDSKKSNQMDKMRKVRKNVPAGVCGFALLKLVGVYFQQYKNFAANYREPQQSTDTSLYVFDQLTNVLKAMNSNNAGVSGAAASTPISSSSLDFFCVTERNFCSVPISRSPISNNKE
jgi:hypothetical protein